ncbi:bifunctional [glutamine synthetase] adenylyltransferase/[glutamine synthetase]-adenylyl-L-tyrosine phosphorylase [Siccirubricoccus sp. G192]|uniref:bifunctional [glutamine synthetase] adenylyltransferase/[glutamine synthetase]-adenylyl-L-tyrosine phosphorylase n=1 Tax=Siccirubricoccus sp. G192 TaxID=2849651 RepID=UPI0028113F03|nr:bifunctional [glutamine synthetase] adenylyltransferase/[glutamine synthetase]-adenylyl-L-tyrosine phosphorylase [Siccirubricoccus sp. G192]
MAAERLAERFAERDAASQAFAASAEGAALLGALGGHSPYLADLALREAPSLLRLAERGPDEALALALDPLTRADPQAGREAVGALLRQVKRQAALIAAVADLAGLWPLDRVTGALSDLADATIDFACAHLLLAAAERGELRLTRGGRSDPRMIAKGSGLIVLGMGKLGGRELNYSSDVDLMLLYDPEAAAYHSDRAGACYVRLARDLVRLLEERTAEGYVFRTDLRLRPDPAATPLAVSVNAAIVYYESMGQNWERAAMIKARPVAGDRALGEHFLREIRPFVWRRHLDFAAVTDIHSIKRQIHAHKGHKGAGAAVALAGHDVKLGRGGIREIEFTAQVLQLIWGGRDPGLRDPTTLGALAALAGAGRIDRRAAVDLADAYVFLRNLEHRLQMVADRQTHRLPEDAAGLARIASFMGFPGTEAFAAAFLGHLGRVERHYGDMFEAAPALSGAGGAANDEANGGNLVFTGVEDDPETIATLRRMGFAEPASVAAMVRGWHHGRPRATRSQRARELLTEMMPALLAAFARQSNPDQALARFDGVLMRLAAGVQILSLFVHNPALLDRVAGILGAAPQLADHLARNPAALDGLLAGSVAPAGTDPSASLPALVKEARHLEEALEVARRLATERKFEIDAAALEGALDADTAGELRADLADAAIAALLPRISADFAERYGRVPGGALAVIALGKLGGREMLPGSDLDLVLLYDHDPEATGSSGGKRSLAPSEYFIRLAPQVVAAITAPGAEGRLWEVDMRLRPSGNKGPVAVRLATFEQYHQENAWTWERMALTRARVVAGPPALRKRIGAVLAAAITRPGASESALADAAAMRARMLRELPPEGPWDVKAMPGGLIEVEFIAQALQLRHAPAQPQILATTTRLALARLGQAGILPAEEAAALIAADRLWRTVIGLIRLTHGRSPEAALPAPAAAALLRAVAPLLEPRPPSVAACPAGAPLPADSGGKPRHDPRPIDLAGLRAQMQSMAGTVRAIFERRVGSLGGPIGEGPQGAKP